MILTIQETRCMSMHININSHTVTWLGKKIIMFQNNMYVITLTSDIRAHICTQEIYLNGEECGHFDSKEDLTFIYCPAVISIFFTICM